MRVVFYLLLFLGNSFVIGQGINQKAIIHEQWLPVKYNTDSLWQEVKYSLNVEHSWVEINQFKKFYDEKFYVKKCFPRFAIDPKWIEEQSSEGQAKIRNAYTYRWSIRNSVIIARNKSDLIFLRDSIDCKIKFNKNHLLFYSISYSGCSSNLKKVVIFHDKKKKEYKFVVFLIETGLCQPDNSNYDFLLIPKIPHKARFTFHYFYFSERIQRKK